MATVGRPKTGGRQKGTPNKPVEITKEQINQCFQTLGGMRWLEKFANDFPESFVRLILVRILPALPAPPVVEINNNQVVQVDKLSDFEIARRLAFCLAKAANEQGLYDPVVQTKVIEPPAPAEPTTLEYPQASELPPDVDVEQYGSAAEQGRRRKLI